MGFKKYAYYNHGNKVAIVEKETSSTSANKAVAHCTIGGYDTKATCEAAGGQWIPSSSGIGGSSDQKYISPKESVSDGLEIEYSYAPIYNFQTQGKEGQDLHKFLGWGSNGTNLVLFAFGNGAIADLSSYFSDGDWIHISGSGRWSGLHQVDLGTFNGSTDHNTTILSHGILTLKTRCYLPASYMEITVDYATNNTANGTNTGRDVDIETFKNEISKRTDPHVFINFAASVANHGLFSLSSDDTVGQLTFNKKYSMDVNGNYTSAAPSIVGDSGDVIAIYSAFYEEITVRERIEVLEDETFDLDLTSYQSKAIVYYVKAKMSEEGRDMEGREYFMRLFKKQLEKERSARKRGPYIAMGNSNMRSY